MVGSMSKGRPHFTRYSLHQQDQYIFIGRPWCQCFVVVSFLAFQKKKKRKKKEKKTERLVNSEK